MRPKLGRVKRTGIAAVIETHETHRTQFASTTDHAATASLEIIDYKPMNSSGAEVGWASLRRAIPNIFSSFWSYLLKLL